MDTRIPQRIAAVSALTATLAATVLVVAGAGGAGAGGSAPVDAALRPVAEADQRLSRELRALEPGVSTKPAVEAVRAADQAGERAVGLLEAAGDRAGRRALGAVRRHQVLIDAIGSTLANPASPLRERLPVLGRDALRAFEELGIDGAGRLPAGRFAAFSRRRAAG